MEAIKNTFMTVRYWIKRVYAGYSVYVNILLKWALAYAALTYINQYFPGRSFMLRPIVVIAISLLCGVLPWSYVSLFSAAWLLLQLSALSLEACVFVFIILLVLALLRYLMLPGTGAALVLLPVFFLWKIPFAVPILVGLLGTVSGFITVASGVVLYYLLQMIYVNLPYLTDPEAATMVQRLLFLVEKTLGNETMLAVLIAFCLTTLVVYLISKLSVPFSPQIAILIGTVFDPLLLNALLRFFSLTKGPEDMVWGSVAAFFIGLTVSFFVRFLDYSGTERVQFEDDEYYYYVKAVPKLRLPGEETLKKRPAEAKKEEAGRETEDEKAADGRETASRSRGNAGRRSRAAIAVTEAVREEKTETADSRKEESEDA